MKKIKFAFSLAEVLMTLGLIGVVATMTVPTLLENINEARFRASLKTVYSKLGVNLDSILLNTTSEEGSSPCNSFDCFNEITADTFISPVLFNASTACLSGCSTINKTEPPGFNALGTSRTYSLSNGMTMKVMPRIGGCGVDNNRLGQINAIARYNAIDIPICALVYIDVNGQAGPNNFSNDQFAFFITADKDVQSYDNVNRQFIKEASRSTNLLPLGLDRTKHGNYTSNINNAGTDCNRNNFLSSLNCTAEVIDGEGNWKPRHDCWKAKNQDNPTVQFEKVDCNKCTVGRTCYKQ